MSRSRYQDTPCEKLIKILAGYGYATNHIHFAKGFYKSADCGRWHCHATITNKIHPQFNQKITLTSWFPVKECCRTRDYVLEFDPPFNGHPYEREVSSVRKVIR